MLENLISFAALVVGLWLLYRWLIAKINKMGDELIDRSRQSVERLITRAVDETVKACSNPKVEKTVASVAVVALSAATIYSLSKSQTQKGVIL